MYFIINWYFLKEGFGIHTSRNSQAYVIRIKELLVSRQISQVCPPPPNFLLHWHGYIFVGYFKTWTVDHGQDCGLDYGPNSVRPPHAYILLSWFSPCACIVLYVDLTAKLALPCQLVHGPFEFLLAQYTSAFLGVALVYDYDVAQVTSLECRVSVVCCPAKESGLSERLRGLVDIHYKGLGEWCIIQPLLCNLFVHS